MTRPSRYISASAWRRFQRDQTGSMTIFGLFIFVIILTVGGIAVDIMRYEYKRVTLQNTADRAVLAAGSLRQPNDPEEVVREYFRREGMEDYIVGVNVDEGLNFRRVNVQTSDTSPTMFMKLLGINELTMTPVSASEERYSKVEVSLVLDISGSMNSNSRITNLRSAGLEFIDTLFENSEPGQVSVSIIPYAAQVNLGPDFSSYFNISPRLTQSQCVDFAPNDYTRTQISDATPLVGTGHFDPWGSVNGVYPEQITCPQNNNGAVLAFSDNPALLRNRISGLSAEGGTSIEVGVKWGAALLDPAMRPVISEMIVDGRVSNAFNGRPLAYEDEDALKVLVLMTDGENFPERRMRSEYKSGISPFTNGTRRLSWDEVWVLRNVAWVRNSLGSYNSRPTIVDEIAASTKNQYLETICDTVNARGIPIFTVAFEAPDAGRAAMQMCATSLSHYFDVNGTDIRGAFRAIAGTINRLRLTQ